MGKWDAMKAAYEAAPEGTALVLCRAGDFNRWVWTPAPKWYDYSTYRLFLNATEWQPPAPLYQSRVEIPRPLTTLEGRDEAWLVKLSGVERVTFHGEPAQRGAVQRRWLEMGLLYANKDDAIARREAMLRVEEA